MVSPNETFRRLVLDEVAGRDLLRKSRTSFFSGDPGKNCKSGGYGIKSDRNNSLGSSGSGEGQIDRADLFQSNPSCGRMFVFQLLVKLGCVPAHDCARVTSTMCYSNLPQLSRDVSPNSRMTWCQKTVRSLASTLSLGEPNFFGTAK